jgi:hypothetical protein
MYGCAPFQGAILLSGGKVERFVGFGNGKAEAPLLLRTWQLLFAKVEYTP